MMEDPSQSPATKFLGILHEVANLENIIDYKIVFNDNPRGADGYICSITEADIVSPTKSLSLIIKSCGSTDKIRNVAPIKALFNNETHMYQVVFPAFKEFVSDHGHTPKQFAPIFYNYFHRNEYDAIILNNLKKDGFSLHNRKDQFDDNYAKLGLDNYARFHAIAFAFREQKPLQFKATTDKLEESFLEYLKHGGLSEMFKQIMSKPVALLETEINSNVKEVYNKFTLNVENYLVNIHSTTDEFSAVVHGDCWKNNMLFKNEDNSDPSIPTDMRFIDFQFSRVASPMLDIASFFYAGSTKEVIDNVAAYLDFYYHRLSTHLKDLGANVHKVYPRSVMMDHWKKFAALGLIIRLGGISILLSSDDNERKGISETLEIDGNVSNLMDYKISDMERYKDLNKHIIEHFVKNNLLSYF